MPMFNLCLAVAVQAYGNVEIEADSLEAAVEIARSHANENPHQSVWDQVTDCEWDTQGCFRVVDITAEDDPKDRLDGIDLTNEDATAVISAEELATLIAQMRNPPPSHDSDIPY